MSAAGDGDEPEDDSMSIALFDQYVPAVLLTRKSAIYFTPGSCGRRVGWTCSRHGDGAATMRTRTRTRMSLWRTSM